MGEPELPRTTEEEEELARRARALREALDRSAGNTERMAAVLGSFDSRLAAVDAAMRPTHVRTHAIRMAHDNIDRTIKVAEEILAQFDIARRAEDTILKGPHEDLKSYLEAVDQLKGIIGFFPSSASSKSSEGVLNHVDNLLTKSALMIEDEFRQLMGACSKPVEPDCLFDCLANHICTSKGDSQAVEGQQSESSATYRNPTLIPPRILLLLHDIAHQLVQDGNHQSCYRIYRDARGSALELSLRKLGLENLSKDDVQRMQWEALKAKIGNWNQFMQIAVKVLIAGERKNCDQVFDGITFNKDQCFAEVAGVSFMTLLSFGDAVVKSKRSPEKLFVLLDMFGVMHDLQSEFEVIFQGGLCSGLRETALDLTKSLAQTAQKTFVDFEDAVEKHTSPTIILDGNVNSLTINVISYVKSLFDYQSTLKILCQQYETGGPTESQLAVVITKILQALQNNLDGKSKQYKDSALGYIFLTNNLHYMVTSVRKSEAKDILGDDWIQRHRKIVQQNANQYKRVAWTKILQTLSVQAAGATGSSAPSDPSSTRVSRAMIKERFKSFNMQFEELHTKQSQWAIPDQELRECLRLAVAEVLLPAYRSFVTRFGSLVERGKNPHKYLRHSPEEVDQLLGEFFEGQQTGEQKW